MLIPITLIFFNKLPIYYGLTWGIIIISSSIILTVLSCCIISRFEEPEQEFLKHYPRNIEDSVRAKKQKRKEAREAYEKRKKEEKEQKRQEIARLKSLKYQEIQDKILKIKQASGNEDIDLGVSRKNENNKSLSFIAVQKKFLLPLSSSPLFLFST